MIFRVAILAGAANGPHACLHAFKARGVKCCGGFGKDVCLGQKIIPAGPDLWLCFRFRFGALRLKGCGNLARHVGDGRFGGLGNGGSIAKSSCG